MWRKGGIARQLGHDEQHLYEALRWLGLSSRSMSDAEPTLWDVGKYIFTGELSLGGEEEALEYACTCTAAGCVLPDLDPAAAALELEEQL